VTVRFCWIPSRDQDVPPALGLSPWAMERSQFDLFPCIDLPSRLCENSPVTAAEAACERRNSTTGHEISHEQAAIDSCNSRSAEKRARAMKCRP
jgi:hypothetical protein